MMQNVVTSKQVNKVTSAIHKCQNVLKWTNVLHISLLHQTVLICMAVQGQNGYCAIHPLNVGWVPKGFNVD